MELEQKQEYHHHHHRPMYKAESAWDLDIEKIHVPLTSGTVLYIPGYGTGLYHIIIDADLMRASLTQH